MFLIRCVTYPAVAWKVDEQASLEMMDLLLALIENVPWFKKYLSGTVTINTVDHKRFAEIVCESMVV